MGARTSVARARARARAGAAAARAASVALPVAWAAAGLAPWAARAGAGESLLHELDGGRAPDPAIFPSVSGHMLPPLLSEVQGPKHTNKFWANWAVPSGAAEAIFPMPFALKWRAKGDCQSAELVISHGTPEFEYGGSAGPSRIGSFRTPFVGELSLGTVEILAPGYHAIVREGLFGIHAEVRALSGSSGRKVLYPIFSGMAYVSALYTDMTPQLSAAPRTLVSLNKLRPGVWSYKNSAGREFRVFVLTADGAFVDDSFEFVGAGRLNKPLSGWIRAAAVNAPGDVDALDAHAGSVLVGWDLEVEPSGVVRYRFEPHAAGGPQTLHFAYAHHVRMLSGGAQRLAAAAPSRTPTKGEMRAVVGNEWTLQVDTHESSHLDFLPPGEPGADRREFLEDEALGTLDWFLTGSNWRSAMFKGSYYFSGKGFQKVAMVCLLVEKFFGAEHSKTQECAGLLVHGFQCLYNRMAAGDCAGAPQGSYYDEDWGGIPSREGFHDHGCFGSADFGNACYNDHHYHFGYFVVSAAILAKLAPEYAEDDAFVAYVHDLIRDTANPGSNDPFFPRFRSFDWFDLHSWSRGVVPSGEGKDQESTSEEVNLLYGLYLWGRVRNDTRMEQLGSTMLALCSTTIKEFFLMESSNPHYPADFVKNHVTGIFFQNKLHYTTWFGTRKEFIHGIQMMPLTPALRLSRRAEFCQQEWDDVISTLPLESFDTWTSVLLTGSLALIDPDEAYGRLTSMDPGNMDDGLTRSYALYWAAVAQASVTPPPTITEGPTTEALSTTQQNPIAEAPPTTEQRLVAEPASTEGPTQEEAVTQQTTEFAPASTGTSVPGALAPTTQTTASTTRGVAAQGATPDDATQGPTGPEAVALATVALISCGALTMVGAAVWTMCRCPGQITSVVRTLCRRAPRKSPTCIAPSSPTVPKDII